MVGVKDTETTNRFVDLLRQTLREQEHHSLAVHGKQRYFYFRATRDLSERRVATNSRGQGSHRLQGLREQAQPGEIAEYRHYAVGISFVKTDEGWAAQLTPTYHYTFDGHRELPWAADRLSGMKQLNATRPLPHSCGSGPATSAARGRSAKSNDRSCSVNRKSPGGSRHRRSDVAANRHRDGNH